MRFCRSGSFTGLRIGISQAKAMAYAFNKLTVAVPTLKTLATVGVTPGIICSVMDARRAQCTVDYMNTILLIQIQILRLRLVLSSTSSKN